MSESSNSNHSSEQHPDRRAFIRLPAGYFGLGHALTSSVFSNWRK